MAITGPTSAAFGEPNPFAEVVVGVFTSPGGKRFIVPGVYDGDGKGGVDGNVWKVRFAADQIGPWSFRSLSENKLLEGNAASFTVTTPPDDAPDFYRWGHLEAISTAEDKIRYLKFRDGPYWLKAGCDAPENFLGMYKTKRVSGKMVQESVGCSRLTCLGSASARETRNADASQVVARTGVSTKKAGVVSVGLIS
ncbi:MAG: DUF5060 domain-containing protein [Planctomycetota bacterium]|nr:DUF5060 domain-containing protein [Planctomycetota bacterium]